MRVGIVGGGITGLALTHALARRGVESVLFERSARAGGIIRSVRFDGVVFEVGPQRTRLVPPVRRLVEELDLGDAVLRAREGARLHVWARGRLHQVPARLAGLLRGSLLPPSARARVFAELFTGGLRSRESVADYFTRKAGGQAYRTLFGPLVSATFASDPARMPARHSLPMILEPLGVRRSLVRAAAKWKGGGAPACTFTDGMEMLVARLADVHGDRIRLATEVAAMCRSGRQISVSFARGGGETVDHVVLTTPAAIAGGLIRDFSLEGGAAAEHLTNLRYNEVAMVSLRADPQSGFGFQVALGERFRTRGVTWAGSLFGRGAACTAYLGGGLDPDIADWSDDRVADRAVAEFEEIHGTSAEALAVHRAALPAYDGSWDPMDQLSLPKGVTIAANYRGRLGVSGRIAEAELVAERIARSDV